MSDYIVKIIPTDPFCRMEASKTEQAVFWLKNRISAERMTYSIAEKPVFVDCGGNLAHIVCPICGCEIDFGWWGEKMDELYEADGFAYLNIQTPCCQKNVSLNDLCYDLPCGFSCLEIDIHNPADDLPECLFEQFRTVTGIDAKIIRARI